MAVPYTFGSATTSIPLSQLDSNFATAITLGNTAVQLGNTITSLTGVSNVASATSLSLGSNGNTTAVTIDTSQNVGVGTTSPAAKLDVRAAAAILQVKSDTGTNAVYQTFNNTGGDFYIGRDNSTGTTFGTTTAYTSLFYSAGAYPIAFFTNSTERMRINAGAPILCLSGGNTSATGTGIAFPATQSASSDANTLDDYEEGTWTPTLNFSGSSTGITYAYQVGYYTKVGRAVTVQCYVQFANKGSATGALRIDGLPFTAISGTSNQGYCGVTLWANTLTATVGGYIAFVNPNTTFIQTYYTNTGTISAITQANCNNTSDFMINTTYVIA